MQHDFWFENMQHCPNIELKEQVFHSLIYGADIECSGPDCGRVCDNWPSANDHAEDVTLSIDKNVNLGRVLGPWTEPPCDNFIASPIGAFLRHGTSKIRVIHDLSFPPGESINDFIDPERFTLQYASVDDAARMCMQYDDPAWMAKSDLSAAFQHVLVDPKYWNKLGFKWQNKFYLFACLPFGCRASPYLFNVLAQGLEYMAINRGMSSSSCHYLDDTFTCHMTREKCQQSIDTFNETARLAGFTLQPEKCTNACQEIEFLGIQINTLNSTLSISNERMADIVSELKTWKGRTSCTKRQLLSLVGKLSFSARVIRSGRTFLRRLIDLSKKVKFLHYKIRLNRSAQADIDWWLECISTHNGVAMFPTEWGEIDCNEMYTDASDRALGVVMGDKWTVYPLQGNAQWLKSTSIHYRELLAVCKGVATFGELLRNSKVKLHVDNQAIVYAINAGTIKCERSMELLKSLYYMLCQFNIEVKAEYISTVDNVKADALSRLELDRFMNSHTSAERSMTFPKPVQYYTHDI